MHMNAIYKAFVAEAAARVAAAVSAGFTDMSLLKDKETAEQIAIASVNVADKLATELESWWECKGDHATVMFDPSDTVMSRVEAAIYSVGEDVENAIKGD